MSRIAHARHGVTVDALDTASGRLERWQARQAVVALPLWVALTLLTAFVLAHVIWWNRAITRRRRNGPARSWRRRWRIRLAWLFVLFLLKNDHHRLNLMNQLLMFFLLLFLLLKH